MPQISKKIKSLPWDEVESAIRKEIEWLKNTILPSPFEKGFCDECIYRQIATLILQGLIKIKNITSENDSLWIKSASRLKKSHGNEWHSEMMNVIAGHFEELGCEIVVEPNLSNGRADLGIYCEKESPLYVEVGTVSLPKLLVNLKTMGGSVFLVVPHADHVIEFSVIEADVKSKLFHSDPDKK
jgi:hypothetical protein